MHLHECFGEGRLCPANSTCALNGRADRLGTDSEHSKQLEFVQPFVECGSGKRLPIPWARNTGGSFEAHPSRYEARRIIGQKEVCFILNSNLSLKNSLVIYVVNTLTEQYPHISKTSIGHVVQLLYRASCFNVIQKLTIDATFYNSQVIKQDGQSSLMQLKEEFRNYDGLRAEHDAQIVQIAMEAGLRISPDQWSSLLYGDCKHRKHMGMNESIDEN